MRLLSKFVRFIIQEAFDEQNKASKEDVIALFKLWHQKFFEEWRREQIEVLVSVLIKPQMRQFYDEIVDMHMRDANTLVPQIVNAPSALKYMMIHHKENNSRKDDVIVFDKQANSVTERFGYWGKAQTPGERIKVGTNDMMRLEEITVPYDAYKEFVERSNSLTELKSKLLQYKHSQRVGHTLD